MVYIKKVNGLSIYFRTREEMDKILKAKGDWGITYYVPGRVLYGYVVNTYTYDRYSDKKIKHVNEFVHEIDAVNFCKTYQKPEKPVVA
jgi:hypothetical protein